MYKDGKLDRSYGAEMAKAEQSKIVRSSIKIDEAILKARQDLIESAKQYG